MPVLAHSLFIVITAPGYSVVSVIPESDQFLAATSPFNATFTCNVSEDELNSAQRGAEWEVNSVIIPSGESPARTAFESIGIFIEEKSVGVTDLVVTSAASGSGGDGVFMVRCTALSGTALPIVIEQGPTLSVRFYGEYNLSESTIVALYP